ncbi:MAG TPA: four helix bundle protein [Gemmatimonadaceae bacterium]
MAVPASRPEELQQRLIRFGIAVCRNLRRRRRDLIVDHFARQLLRSVTAPAANYGEARAAESKADFIHKMRICLKELRETDVWLQFVTALSRDATPWRALRDECNELIAIFVASLKTTGEDKS